MALLHCNKKQLRVGALALAASLLAACASAPPVENNNAEAAPEPPAAALSKQAPEQPISIDQQVAFERGVAALKDGNGVVAVEVFSSLGSQLPDQAAIQANLGSAYMLRGDAQAAIAAYERAVALNPNLATAHVRLGVLFRRADQLEKAEAAYKAALDADPNNRLAHLNLGILYDLYLRKPAQALSEYEQFQALSEQTDKEVALWIADLKQRL